MRFVTVTLLLLLLLLFSSAAVVSSAPARAEGQALSYQFGATAANAGGHGAMALRYRSDNLLFAAFTAPRTAPRGRIGLLAGYRVLSVPISSWITVYSELSLGFSAISTNPYPKDEGSEGSQTLAESREQDSSRVTLATEALWGLRFGWLRLDIASHLYTDPKALRPWSFPLWLGAEFRW